MLVLRTYTKASSEILLSPADKLINCVIPLSSAASESIRSFVPVFSLLKVYS